MLKVTDNGVKITLQSTKISQLTLTQMLVAGVLIAVALLMAIDVLSTVVGSTVIILSILAGYAWQFWQKQSSTQYLTGGELCLTPKALTHYQLGKTTKYQLQPQDTVVIESDTIVICNAQGKPLYHIQGFDEPKQCEIAQAVLNGKTIQTNAKAIRMNDTNVAG